MLDDRVHEQRVDGAGRGGMRRGIGIDSTNSIGGFSFGLHGYGGLSCNGNPCGVLPCVCVLQPVLGLQVVVVVGWMRADRK